MRHYLLLTAKTIRRPFIWLFKKLVSCAYWSWCRLGYLGTEYPKTVFGVFIVTFLGFGYLNYKTFDIPGGPVDDSLPLDNPYRQDHEFVMAQPGFNGGEKYQVIKDLKNVSAEELYSALVLMEKLVKIQKVTPMTLENLPEYVDTGQEMMGLPYLSAEILADFNPEVWKMRVNADQSISQLLVGKNYDWVAVALVPPQNYPGDVDHFMAWKLMEVLEGKEPTWWERAFWKTGIQPEDPSISIAGLGIGRFEIDRKLRFDLIILPVLGILFALPWLVKYLGSFRQACIATVVCVFGGILFNRGSIYLLHLLYSLFHERVYAVLPYANDIVQGVSLSLHLLVAVRLTKGANSKETFRAGIESTFFSMFPLVLTAIVTFAGMSTFGIWQMTEMGVIAAVGIAMIGFIIIPLFMPAVYLTLEEWLGPEKVERMQWNPQSHRAQWLWRFQPPAWLALGFTFTIFTIGASLYGMGEIGGATYPYDMIRGSIVEKTAEKQKARGAGTDGLPLFVTAQHQEHPFEGKFPAAFLTEVWEFQQNLRPGGGFEKWQQNKFGDIHSLVAVGSVLDKVPQIARQSFGKEFVETDRQARSAFSNIMAKLPDDVEAVSWSNEGIELHGSVVVNNSEDFRALIDRVKQYAVEEYPNLRVYPHGKGLFYTQISKIIHDGMGLNILTQIMTLLVSYLLFISIGRSISPEGTVAPSFAAVIALVLPYMFSIGMLGIGMWYLDISISMSTGPTGDLTVSSTTDFGIYLAALYMTLLRSGHTPQAAHQYAIVEQGPVVAMDCVFNMLAFAPLIFSRFEPVREVGIMLIFSLGFCLIGALFLSPPVLQLFTRKEVFYEPQNLIQLPVLNPVSSPAGSKCAL